MDESLTLLNKALVVGNEELESLRAGDIDVVEEKAKDRQQLLSMAMEQKPSVGLEAFQEKLLQLQALQGRLTKEASSLRESIRQELMKSKRESNRLAGYGKAAKRATNGGLYHKRG